MKILVIAPHPDDETLGCGATMLRHKANGDEIHWVVVTAAFEPRWSAELLSIKAEEVMAVSKAYGMSSMQKLGLPTTQLDALPESDLIDALRTAINAVKPDIVYLNHDGDVHSDHRAIFSATLSVLKTFYMKSSGVRRILSYETLSSTEAAPAQAYRVFAPNIYMDVSGFVDRKLEIMSLFKSEVHSDPMPRGPSAIRALARYRGASIGVEHAEAFMLIREVL